MLLLWLVFELGTGGYTEGLSSIAIHFTLAELRDANSDDQIKPELVLCGIG